MGTGRLRSTGIAFEGGKGQSGLGGPNDFFGLKIVSGVRTSTSQMMRAEVGANESAPSANGIS